MYGKHFESMYEGSLVGSTTDVFAIWGYVIAKTRNSYILLNPKLLAPIFSMTEEEVSRTIEKLCEPDPDTTTENDDGRRLVHDHGFVYYVSNWEYYKNLKDAEMKREYDRERQAKLRLKKKLASGANN